MYIEDVYHVSVELKKEMATKLIQLDQNKTLEALVIEAITEYIHNKTFRITNKS
ncbi:MAG: hypothetical protein WAK17_21110 [Candidatus Nitrosopolaris sp.]